VKGSFFEGDNKRKDPQNRDESGEGRKMRLSPWNGKVENNLARDLIDGFTEQTPKQGGKKTREGGRVNCLRGQKRLDEGGPGR